MTNYKQKLAKYLVHLQPQILTNKTFPNFSEITKNVPTMKQMLGPTLTPEHKEHIEWAKKLPNSNWQIWATKQYKNNPKSFTPQIKQKIEHFAGSQHIPEIAKVRFGKEHDLESGLNLLESAEKQYNERIKDNLNLVKPTARTKKLVQGKNKPNRHWYDLGVGSCSAEGKAMGHCGNAPSKVKGDRILSLRTEHRDTKGNVYHEPHLTFVLNNGFLGEMKGRGNEKPTAEYHKDIAELLKDKRIKGVLGGGYASDKNFDFFDLSPELQQEVKQANPDLITLDESGTDKILSGEVQLPKKHLNIKTDLASNPNLHPDHQAKLVNDHHEDVRLAIAENPNLHPDLQAKLINDPEKYIRRAIAENPNLHPDHYAKLVNDPNEDVRKAIAKNPNLHPYLHDKLVSDPIWYVRRAIAENPNLHPKHHATLVNDPDEDVRKIIAINPNLHPKHHTQLVNDPHEYVRMNIAQNPNLHPDHHAKLVNDPHEDVRLAIAQNPNLHPDHQAKLVNDPNEYVRIAIAKNPNLHPYHHAKLVNDPDEYVRLNIARNPNLHPDLQAKLVNDKNDYVRVAIAENPNLHPYHHAKLVNDPDEHVRLNIARNPNLHPDLQAKLVNDKNDYVRVAIAENPNLHPDHHAKLVNDPDDSVRHSIAKNPNLHPDHQAKLVNDTDQYVRRAIAQNPNLHPKHHAKLVNDPDEFVREAIAQNPSYIAAQKQVNKSEQIRKPDLVKKKIVLHLDDTSQHDSTDLSSYFGQLAANFNKTENKKFLPQKIEKMSRPVLKFPGLKAPTRLDQNVKLLTTGKEKDLYTKIAAQHAYPDKTERVISLTYTPDKGFQHGPETTRRSNRKQARSSFATKIGSKFGNRTLGVAVQSEKEPGRSIMGALAGKLRSKFEPAAEEVQNEYLENIKNYNEKVDQYNKNIREWRQKLDTLIASGADTATIDAHRQTLPKLPVRPKKPRAKPTETKKLPPDRQKIRGQDTESVIQHEAAHGLFEFVRQKYGKSAVNKIHHALLSSFQPDTLKLLQSYTKKLGYKPKSEYFNEEIIAHWRDILVSPSKREKFKKFVGPDKADAVIKEMKLNWQKAVDYAKKIVPDDFNKSQDMIPGGLSDKKSPKDFPKDKLKQGILVEMEHANDPRIAAEIAMDHLSEDINYYDKLKLIETKQKPIKKSLSPLLASLFPFAVAGSNKKPIKNTDFVEDPWDEIKEKRSGEDLESYDEPEEEHDYDNWKKFPLKKDDNLAQSGAVKPLKAAPTNSMPRKQDILPTLPKVKSNDVISQSAKFGRAAKGMGKLTATALYRHYKNSPHHPVSLGLKYIVHRIENHHKYAKSTPKQRIKLDQDFLSHHQKGKAKEKNGHINVNHLNAFIQNNPHLIYQVKKHRQKLHDYLLRNAAEEIHWIKGKPHLALNRSLDTPFPGKDHALSSYSDTPRNEFGQYHHHRMVPLDNIWYAYGTGHKAADSPEFGSENELLVSPHKIKYITKENMIKKVIPQHIEDKYGHYNYDTPRHVHNLLVGKNITIEDQAQLVNYSDPYVRQAIAKNPNLHPDHQAKLVNDPVVNIRRIMAENPNLHPDLQAKLVNDPDRDVREAIARNPNLHPDHQAKLLNDPDEYVRYFIAENPNLHPDLQAKLVDDPDEYVREAIAKNPNLHPKHHEKLVNDPDVHVRMNIARTPNLHPKHHATLVNDPDEYVRMNIASNPNLHPDHYAKLVNDPDRDVREAIARNPNLHPDHQAKLANDSDRYIRAAIASNPNLHPDHYAKLVNDPDEDVREAIAANPSYIAAQKQIKKSEQPDKYVFISKEEYRGTHRAPNPQNDSPLHNLTPTYPSDIYSPRAHRFYGHGDDKLDKQTIDIIHRVKDNPDHMVDIYRAVPKHITKIKPGDWVTINKDYAHEHGQGVLNGDYKILSAKVPAKHLYNDGNSIHEYGYHPDIKKSQDYNFTYTKGKSGLHLITAKDRSGRTIGKLTAEDLKDGTVQANMVEVDKDHRRKGIATTMYKLLHEKTGLKPVPDKEAQTKDSVKLWEKLNSVFKSEHLIKAVPKEYRDRAQSYTSLIMPLKLLGHHELDTGIPLHMSIKLFTSPDGHTPDMENIENRIKRHEHKLSQPIDIKKLSFTPGELKNKEGNSLKVLFVHGLPEHFKNFYDQNRDIGTVYPHFMAHITVPDHIWNEVKSKNLTPQQAGLEIQTPHLMRAGSLVRKLGQP